MRRLIRRLINFIRERRQEKITLAAIHPIVELEGEKSFQERIDALEASALREIKSQLSTGRVDPFQKNFADAFIVAQCNSLREEFVRDLDRLLVANHEQIEGFKSHAVLLNKEIGILTKELEDIQHDIDIKKGL